MAAAKKAKEEVKEAKSPVVKDVQNGITRPKAGTKTGRVWEIADKESAKVGKPAKRKDVLDIFVAEGGNVATGATQYGKWRKYHGLVGNGDAEPGTEENGEVVAPTEGDSEVEAPTAPTAGDTDVEEEV